MIMNAKFDLGPLEIPVSEKLANTTIALCLNREDFFPISGFPRSLMLEDALKRRCILQGIKLYYTHPYLHEIVRPRSIQLQKRGRTYRTRIRRTQREQQNSQTSLDELGSDSPKQGRHSTSRGNFLTTLQPAQKLSRHFSLGHQPVPKPKSVTSASSEASTLVETQQAGDTFAFSPDDVGTHRRRSADEASRPTSTNFSISLQDNPLPFDDMATRQNHFIGQVEGLDLADLTVGPPTIRVKQPPDLFELE